MREMDLIEYHKEQNENRKELKRTVRGLKKEPLMSVSDNYIHMIKELLKERGTYKEGNITIRYETEKVLVHDKIDTDEIEDESEFETIINRGDYCEVTYILELDKYMVGGTGILFDVYTTTEAGLLWGLNESTVRKAIQVGRFTIGRDYRKSGRVTLITKEAMERVYGKLE